MMSRYLRIGWYINRAVYRAGGWESKVKVTYTAKDGSGFEVL